MMRKIAILIPCYNESKTIAKVVKDYHRVLPDAEIYVYDNNSSDGTDQIAREAGRSSGMSAARERATSFGRCSARLRRTAT